ncbi:MAG TPA: OST-HTH/LOTUS domain-containing protein, partial [Pseudoxanthomonas sp.]|nr:OST-HTH/LOTUS domain-containing protein [Pseudoxanthomonas sp.]
KAVAPKPAAPSTPATPPAVESKDKGAEPLPLALIRQAIEEASDENGWAFLGSVGSYLNKIRPDFDPRLYGHRKLSDLFKHQPKHFAIDERTVAGGGNKMIYIRSLG